MDSSQTDRNPYEPIASRRRWRHSRMFLMMEVTFVLAMLAGIFLFFGSRKEVIHRSPPIRSNQAIENIIPTTERWVPTEDEVLPSTDNAMDSNAEAPQP